MTEYIKSIITGNYDKYPNKFNMFFSNYGNNKIIKLVIERVPLQQTTMILLNLASNNTALERLKQSDYDKLFHLRLIIYLDNNNITLFVEKNQSLNIGYYNSLENEKGKEQMNINEVPTSQLFNFINNAKNILKDKLFSYNAKNNNCQDFILALLISNNINNNEYQNFIKQDVDFIFKNNSFLKTLINSLTSIGHRIDVISGNGINKLNFNKPLDNFEIQDICNKMKIKLNGIYARNQKIDLKNGNYILNLDSYGSSGTHWTCFIKDKKNIYYFDSFGSYPPLEISELSDKHNLNLYYNKDDIQGYKSILCGYFCIAQFHYIKNKTNKTKNIIDRLNDFISLFNKTNTKKNDNILINYIKQFYV